MCRKIYKFRKLVNKEDFDRLEEIINTRKFYCSTFWSLNDPMEGVFNAFITKEIMKTAGLKKEYKVCSFSGEKGFKNPAMWGYYAGGFKGVVIEIEYSDENSKIEKVNYLDEIPNNQDIKNILLRKNKAWELENEYRFLDKNLNTNFVKIGSITAIYFGNPYGWLVNSRNIQAKRVFVDYNNFRKDIIKICEDQRIKCFNVVVKNGNVKRSQNLF